MTQPAARIYTVFHDERATLIIYHICADREYKNFLRQEDFDTRNPFNHTVWLMLLFILHILSILEFMVIQLLVATRNKAVSFIHLCYSSTDLRTSFTGRLGRNIKRNPSLKFLSHQCCNRPCTSSVAVQEVCPASLIALTVYCPESASVRPISLNVYRPSDVDDIFTRSLSSKLAPSRLLDKKKSQ